MSSALGAHCKYRTSPTSFTKASQPSLASEVTRRNSILSCDVEGSPVCVLRSHAARCLRGSFAFQIQTHYNLNTKPPLSLLPDAVSDALARQGAQGGGGAGSKKP